MPDRQLTFFAQSGLRASFLPIILQHSAPGSPGTLANLDHARLVPCTEPIYTCMQVYEKTGHAKGNGEYLTFWYVGQVREDAVRPFLLSSAPGTRPRLTITPSTAHDRVPRQVVESGTRMADEVNYETHFLSIEDALSVLCGEQRHIMSMGYQLWRETVEMQSQSAYKEYTAHLRAMAHAGGATDLNAYSTGGGAWTNSSHWEGFTSATKVAQDAEP